MAHLKSRLKRWIGLLGAYFTAQSLTQLSGVLAGILVVRHLPVDDFALYTLATSVTALFAIASDLGSTSSLLHFYRAAESRGERFADYVGAVLDLRRTAFALGSVALLVAAPWVGAARGFGRAESLAAALIVLVVVWCQIGSSIRLVLLRLAARYGAAYRAELGGGLLRLGLIALLVALSRLSTLAALAAGALAAALVLARADSPAAHPERGERTAARRAVGRYLVPMLPSALYFAIQGPLIIWLAATFGNTRSIAEVGALGRLGMIVGLLTGLSSAVLVPRLAGVSDPRTFATSFLRYGALLAALAGIILLSAALVPNLFLAILGPHYRGLRHELLLIIAASGLSMLGSYVANVNLSRGWTRLQAAALAGEVAVQAALIASLPLATTAGVIWFQLGSATAGIAFQLAIFGVGFRRPAWAGWR
jgi:O-antigen/teichoic acid export membrane protein